LIDREGDSGGMAEGSTPGDPSASKQEEESPKAMPKPEQGPLSSEEITEFHDMLDCTRPAKFALWEDEDPSQARESESGVPCGTELPPRDLIRGWEVCERCIKNRYLKCALLIGIK
jgi:hypothetical protein